MELDILGVQIIMKPGTVPNKLSLTPLSLNYSSPIKDIIVTDLTQFRYSGYLLIARSKQQSANALSDSATLGQSKTAKLGAKPTSKTRWAVPVRNQKEKSSDYRSMLDDFKICEWKDCGSPKMKPMNSNN
ncbi:hypothetical protein M8J75_015578 [Diaphorina citri]|nr:hypothetical protein M8J75_015578 [Diaphorina citri]